VTDLIDQLDRATRTTGDVVAAVKPDQLDDRTPCTEWTVRDLLNHLVGVAQMFTTAAAGEKSTVNPFGSPEDVIGDDPRAAYDEARQQLLSAYRERGLDGTVPLLSGDAPATFAVTICITDNLQHGWDLAKAIGQPFDPDDDVISTAEEFTGQNMSPDRRGPGKPFAHPVDPPRDASHMDRLAASLGRQV
jgi:uncharacterized protein (TIGR03086 family)